MKRPHNRNRAGKRRKKRLIVKKLADPVQVNDLPRKGRREIWRTAWIAGGDKTPSTTSSPKPKVFATDTTHRLPAGGFQPCDRPGTPQAFRLEPRRCLYPFAKPLPVVLGVPQRTRNTGVKEPRVKSLGCNRCTARKQRVEVIDLHGSI